MRKEEGKKKKKKKRKKTLTFNLPNPSPLSKIQKYTLHVLSERWKGVKINVKSQAQSELTENKKSNCLAGSHSKQENTPVIVLFKISWDIENRT